MLALSGSVSIGSGEDGIAHVGGVKRCASPWACPVCAPTIGERRAREVDQMIAACIAEGGSALFVTATLQHTSEDELAELLDVVQRSWSRTWRFKKRPDWYGGQSRAIEVVWGARNGWHPHVHAVVFVEAGHPLEVVEAEVQALGQEWARHAEAQGRKARVSPVRDRQTGELVRPGWHVRRVTEAGAAASYLTKVEGGWNAGLELARADLKKGKGITPLQLLDQAVLGDGRAQYLYSEYEQATFGRRRIVTSPGLAKRWGVDEVSDDEAAAAAPEQELVVRVELPAETWQRLMAAGFIGQLLDDVEDLALGNSDGWPWPEDWLVFVRTP
jgi:hypothetical protein